VATGSPPDVAGLVVDLAASRPPTLGHGRLVCVDGPAGSGKTTLGRAIAERTGAEVVNTDELMDGWSGLATVTAQLTALVAALAEGRTGEYHRYLWGQGRFDEAVTYVRPGPWLVVEGVGSAEPAIAANITALVWVEVDDDLRLARGLARDGVLVEPEWREFMLAEREIFARDRTFERADVLVDGTGTRPPVVRP
jgi:uridine kinase